MAVPPSQARTHDGRTYEDLFISDYGRNDLLVWEGAGYGPASAALGLDPAVRSDGPCADWPGDLRSCLYVSWGTVYDDLDGDGVEDNVKRTRDELDDFYYPNRFGDAGDDVYNTHHGNLPGHLRLEEYEFPPKDHHLYKFQENSHYDTHFLYGGSEQQSTENA